MKDNTYAAAGVDIEKGEQFASYISKINSNAVSKSIGGFAGGLEIDTTRYKHPVILSCTDGVGTKLLVAQKMKKFDTVGIDLVAMSVNDLIVCGASPISFLDYIGCGRLNDNILKDVIKGIVDGCEQAECELSGGETAEMPDIYAGNEFDLAGFCVGLVEKDERLPRKDLMTEGCVILGLPSSGIHSNGLSLARKAVSETDTEAWNQMLVPTRIYIKDMKKLISTGKILGAAHITGGGLEGNTKRVLPENLGTEFSWDWKTPSIFDTIQKQGNISQDEMRKVFNMGIGMAIIVPADAADEVMAYAKKENIEIFKAGTVTHG